MTKESSRWYADDGEWMRPINEKLRERPTGHADPTDEDRYFDSAPYDTEDDIPWLDNREDDREHELE